MTRAFVVGWPVAHSRSPLIHGTWLKRHGIDGEYRREAVPVEGIDAFLAAIGARGDAGGNVTLPHKEAAFRAAARHTAVAAALGAANTLWLEDGVLWADNTDVHGFAANLDERAPDWRRGGMALVIGAGGAARAAVLAIRDAGYRRVVVLNRTRARADDLAAHFGGGVEAGDLEALRQHLSDADLVVNATSAGLKGGEGLAIPWRKARPDAIATDLLYVPLMTPFLADAAARGLRTVDGLGMLLHQAVPGFERWFGVRPEVDADLRRVVVADIGGADAVRILGLTGSIGMGKSTTAQMFAARGVAVHDADAAVHDLYRGAAVAAVEAAFPGVSGPDGIDRPRLADRVLGDAAALARLEAIVHPMVIARERAFLAAMRAQGRRLVVLDIPLLFEADAVPRVDAIVVVTAPEAVQRARVMGRRGMTEARFAALLARQLPDAEKRRRAHMLVDSGRGLEPARRDVDAVLRALCA